MKVVSIALIGAISGFKLNQNVGVRFINEVQKKAQDDPICGGLGCEANHGIYNVRPEAFEMNNTKRNLFMQVKSDPICSSAGCPEKKEEDGHPINYKVPNFGSEHETVDHTAGSLEWAEKHYNHKWVPDMSKDKKHDEPIQYNHNPELDADMQHTKTHMDAAESKLGKWTMPKE